MEKFKETVLHRSNSETIIHVWQKEDWGAVHAAIGAGRPLLLRGEPGTGKTQLAAAAAKELNRPLVSFTADSRTESRDLLWHFDPVMRLAEAQLLAALLRPATSSATDTQSQAQSTPLQLREQLAIKRFVRPGPLWWGLNWKSALDQDNLYSGFNQDPSPISAINSPECTNNGYTCPYKPPDGWDESQGVVVLIDELDKAPIDVPNGLLEVFALWQFRVPGVDMVQQKSNAIRPLVVITTNEDRPLSDAFLRRCAVHSLVFPEQQRLIELGKMHFPSLSEGVVTTAAAWLIEDRKSAENNGQILKPGLAEYLDFLRAFKNNTPDWTREDLRGYFFRKSLGVPAR